MSFTSEVSAFMDTLGPFYESVDKEDELNQISSHQGKPNSDNLPLEYADKEDNIAEPSIAAKNQVDKEMVNGLESSPRNTISNDTNDYNSIDETAEDDSSHGM